MQQPKKCWLNFYENDTGQFKKKTCQAMSLFSLILTDTLHENLYAPEM
jgi:hypothetical protein